MGRGSKTLIGYVGALLSLLGLLVQLCLLEEPQPLDDPTETAWSTPASPSADCPTTEPDPTLDLSDPDAVIEDTAAAAPVPAGVALCQVPSFCQPSLIQSVLAVAPKNSPPTHG